MSHPNVANVHTSSGGKPKKVKKLATYVAEGNSEHAIDVHLTPKAFDGLRKMVAFAVDSNDVAARHGQPMNMVSLTFYVRGPEKPAKRVKK